MSQVVEAPLESWVEAQSDSDFPLENLPFGVFSRANQSARIGVAIGTRVLDLHAASELGLFDDIVAREILQKPTLNALAAAGRSTWSALRARLIALLRGGATALQQRNVDALLPRQTEVRMHVPVEVGDYVDFYSSLEHATNLGKIFRPNGEPLLPNWRWLPVGYHGRSSTIVVDGTPVTRPSGQRKAPQADAPTFGTSAMLDIELEMGFITGPGNPRGTRIAAGAAREHIFGLVLVNDWSARDIQAWEYQPLGPFLGKSFATSVSPWVVTLDALEPFRVAGPRQEPPPLPYLQVGEPWNYDVTLDVLLQTARMRESADAPARVARSNFKYMYWNMAQQIAHATVNGATVRPGDLFASGTISGPTPDSYGSFIELSWRGARPLKLPSGEQRSFLEDGDTVTLRGYCERAGARRIGFGKVRGTIMAGLHAAKGPP